MNVAHADYRPHRRNHTHTSPATPAILLPQPSPRRPKAVNPAVDLRLYLWHAGSAAERCTVGGAAALEILWVYGKKDARDMLSLQSTSGPRAACGPPAHNSSPLLQLSWACWSGALRGCGCHGGCESNHRASVAVLLPIPQSKTAILLARRHHTKPDAGGAPLTAS